MKIILHFFLYIVTYPYKENKITYYNLGDEISE